MAKSLHKGQIVDIVAEGTGLTKVDTAAVLDGILATIIWSLANGKNVSLRGFGSFKTSTRSGRHVKSPKNGEEMWIEPQQSVSFRPSRDLREAVKNGLPKGFELKEDKISSHSD